MAKEAGKGAHLLYGAGRIMSIDIIEQLVRCAHFAKIRSVEDLKRETKWSRVEKHGPMIMAILREHFPELPPAVAPQAPAEASHTSDANVTPDGDDMDVDLNAPPAIVPPTNVSPHSIRDDGEMPCPPTSLNVVSPTSSATVSTLPKAKGTRTCRACGEVGHIGKYPAYLMCFFIAYRPSS